MAPFFGRRKELQDLKGLLKKKSSSLVVVRGRRRIGKSRLAEEFSKAFPRSFTLTGLAPDRKISAQDQRDDFIRQMRQLQIPMLGTDDWGDLFTDLSRHCQKGRVLITLDEVPWMGGKDPTFLPKLKSVWDLHFKKNPQLVLLISGSNSTWVDENILSSTGFLGRVSYELRLEELSLQECNRFWNGDSSISAFEKFKILSVTGGVPRYLEEIRLDLSAEQNLLKLCYQQTGILFTEFDRIFSDLFERRNRLYKEIVRQALAHSSTMKQILEKIGRSRGGDLSRYFADLVESGFLKKQKGWNIEKQKESGVSYYRISDNYVRFYLKYIEPFAARIKAEQMAELPSGWTSIMGLQFENLICNNLPILASLLELRMGDLIWAGPFLQTATLRRQGCQIDCLVQTKHRVLYLCEVKFSQEKIGTSVLKEVQEKIKRLQTPRGFSVRPVLIHVNGVSEGVVESDFFSNILDFEEFLNQV